MFLAQNLKLLRQEKGLTQEALAAYVGVTGQAVSKWERDECYPDITLLPKLANCFGVTVDQLLGMAEMNDQQRQWADANTLQQQGKYAEAAEIFEQMLQTFPADSGLLAAHATTLVMAGSDLEQAISLCEQAMNDTLSDKRRASTAAVLCCLYHAAGRVDDAVSLARSRPHARESRELLLPRFLPPSEREAYLREQLPGILTELYMLINGREPPLEERLRAIELGLYDTMMPPAEAAQAIADFLAK